MILYSSPRLYLAALKEIKNSNEREVTNSYHHRGNKIQLWKVDYMPDFMDVPCVRTRKLIKAGSTKILMLQHGHENRDE